MHMPCLCHDYHAYVIDTMHTHIKRMSCIFHANLLQMLCMSCKSPANVMHILCKSPANVMHISSCMCHVCVMYLIHLSYTLCVWQASHASVMHMSERKHKTGASMCAEPFVNLTFSYDGFSLDSSIFTEHVCSKPGVGDMFSSPLLFLLRVSICNSGTYMQALKNNTYNRQKKKNNKKIAKKSSARLV